MRFALNTCRRNRFAARTDDAVFESGPMHGLVQGAANWGTDAAPLVGMLVPADLYVRLRAPADVLVERLVDREGDEALRATQHDWLVEYERMLDAALQGRPVIEVDTDCSLDEAMERACTAVANAPQLAGLRRR